MKNCKVRLVNKNFYLYYSDGTNFNLALSLSEFVIQLRNNIYIEKEKISNISSYLNFLYD